MEGTIFSSGHINDDSLMEKEQSYCEPFCAPDIDEGVNPDVSPVVKSEPGTSRARSHCSSDRTDTDTDGKPDGGNVDAVVKEEFGSSYVLNLEGQKLAVVDSGSFDGKIFHNFEVPCSVDNDVRQTVENKCIDIEIKDEPLLLFPEEDIKTNMSPKSADGVEDEPQFPDHSLELKSEIENYYVKQEVLEQECVSMLDRSSEAGGKQLQICDVRSLCVEQSSNPDTDAVVSTVSGSTSTFSADPALFKYKISNSCSAQSGIEDQGTLRKRNQSILGFLDVGPVKLWKPRKSRQEINKTYYEKLKQDGSNVLQDRLKKQVVTSKRYRQNLKAPGNEEKLRQDREKSKLRTREFRKRQQEKNEHQNSNTVYKSKTVRTRRGIENLERKREQERLRKQKERAAWSHQKRNAERAKSKARYNAKKKEKTRKKMKKKEAERQTQADDPKGGRSHAATCQATYRVQKALPKDEVARKEILISLCLKEGIAVLGSPSDSSLPEVKDRNSQTSTPPLSFR